MTNIPHGYCQCGCNKKTSIATVNSTVRGHIKGQPIPYFKGHSKNHSQAPSDKRFAKSVQRGTQNDCWIWTGRILNSGYGAFVSNGKTFTAHRFAWIQANNQDIPENMVICHSCDNRLCVNPTHLFLGSQTDNMIDMVHKGRHARNYNQGESHPQSKLTRAQVDSIREQKKKGSSLRTLAKMFNVSISTIADIVKHRHWK